MCCSTLPAHAKPEATAKTNSETGLLFLHDNTLEPGLVLPAPPAADSAEGKTELALVRKTVESSSSERIKQAAYDDAHESAEIYEGTIPGLTFASLPVTAKLFRDLENDQEIITKNAKKHFARKRPFQIDPTMPTCVPSSQDEKPTSYPSSHTTMGYATGVVLAHLIPEKATAIYEKAQDYAKSRVICGVHFPSDLVASQTLGTAIAVELLENPDFQKEFDAAKAELVKAGLTHP